MFYESTGAVARQLGDGAEQVEGVAEIIIIIVITITFLIRGGTFLIWAYANIGLPMSSTRCSVTVMKLRT